MNTEKYIVRLSDEERQELETVIKKLKGTSQKVNRALALLHADAKPNNAKNPILGSSARKRRGIRRSHGGNP